MLLPLNFTYWRVLPVYLPQRIDTYLEPCLISDSSIISQRPSSKVVVEGETVTLYCNATGNPAPNITWTQDNNKTALYQGENYTIVNIQRQAAGDYTCTAWNGVGEKANATATVTVH